jgi:predicted nucleic acid-binding Zn finger protein
MAIAVVSREVKFNKFGACKYTRITSSTDPTKFYDVVKIRVHGTRNYKYQCTCPDFVFRQKPCKHINKFKKDEAKGRYKRGGKNSG